MEDEIIYICPICGSDNTRYTLDVDVDSMGYDEEGRTCLECGYYGTEEEFI